MQSKRKVMFVGVTLLISFSLLFASTPVVKGWDGNLKPLLQAFTWSSNNSTATGYFYNFGTGRALLGISNAWIGVQGLGGTGSGDYGGYFSGFEGVRGVASGSNGYGTWGVASGGTGVGSFGYCTGSNCVGSYGYTTGSSGYGVFGYSANYIAIRGVGGTGSGDYGGFFQGYNGSYGRGVGSSGIGAFGGAPWEGVRGVCSGSVCWGVYGRATGSSSYGVVAQSSKYRGLYAKGASGYFDGYFPTAIFAGSYWTSSTGLMGVIALNDGSEALEPGDLVAFSRLAAADGSSGQGIAVKKANDSNGVVIGVVQSAYVKEAPAASHMQLAEALEAPVDTREGWESKEVTPPQIPASLEGGVQLQEQAETLEFPQDLAPPAVERDEIGAEADVGHFAEGSAQPGQYVAVVIQGITRVKVDTSAAPIQAGDMLVASSAGYAINATTASQPGDGATHSREGAAGESGDLARPPSEVVIGRALEPLESGTGAIYVFVSVR